jgi:hypothetical protein
MLRIPHFLDNRLTDGGKVVILTCRLRFNLKENSSFSFLFIIAIIIIIIIIIIPVVGSLRALKNATEHFMSSSALYRLSFVQRHEYRVWKSVERRRQDKCQGEKSLVHFLHQQVDSLSWFWVHSPFLSVVIRVGVEGCGDGSLRRTSVFSHGHLNVSLVQRAGGAEMCSVAPCESLKCHKSLSLRLVLTRE